MSGNIPLLIRPVPIGTGRFRRTQQEQGRKAHAFPPCSLERYSNLRIRSGRSISPKVSHNLSKRVLNLNVFRKFLVLVAFSLTACGQVPPQIKLPGPYLESGIKVTVDGLWKDAEGHVTGVSGLATNESGRNLITCVVNLDVLDASGVKVAGATASTTGLKASQTWRFQAVFTNPFSVNFQSIAPGQIIALPEPETFSAQEQAGAAAAKQIVADLGSCAEAAFSGPESQIIAAHWPLNPAELSASQLSDPAFPTEQELRALTILYPRLQTCQKTAIDEFRRSSVAAVVPILSEGYARSAARIDLLKERKITWGAFNTERKSSAAEMHRQLVATLSGHAH